MDQRISNETPLWQLTVGEFLSLAKSLPEPAKSTERPEEFVYGYDGISKMLGGVSKATVFRLLRSGRIAPAISQSGKTIICNVSLALKLLNKPQGGRR